MALSNENGSNSMVMPVVPYGNNSGSSWVMASVETALGGCLYCSYSCLMVMDGEMDGTMAVARFRT